MWDEILWELAENSVGTKPRMLVEPFEVGVERLDQLAYAGVEIVALRKRQRVDRGDRRVKRAEIDRPPQQWHEPLVVRHRVLGFLPAHGGSRVIGARDADKRIDAFDSAEHALLPVRRELDVFAIEPALALLLGQCLGEPLREQLVLARIRDENLRHDVPPLAWVQQNYIRAEAILLRAQAIHPKVAMIAFNLACYASVTGRFEQAKVRLRHAVQLERTFGDWRSITRI